MELDTTGPPNGATLDTDLCIIGAGPAGLALASECAGAGMAVLLLESGSHNSDPAATALNEGEVVGDAYAGLRETRHRQIGGTAAIWNTRTPGGVGAKFTPLDPIDLESRQAVPYSGWPMSFEQLAPWYSRAHAMCGLGSFAYDAADWPSVTREPLENVGPAIESRVYQFGARNALLTPMLRAVAAASNVRLVSGATVVRLETDSRGARVVRAQVASRVGAAWTVSAREFVLCGGAIENARLLLASGGTGAGLGNRSGWVGRCFMEHPRDRALALRVKHPEDYRSLRFYDLYRPSANVSVAGRLGIAADTLRQQGLLNASATLLPIVRPMVRRLREALGPLARRAPLDRWLPRGGLGWSAHPAPGIVLEGFTVLLNLEQAPDPDNRIVLGRRRDALGVPRAELHWRWNTIDEQSRQNVRAFFAAAFAQAGFEIVRHPRGSVDPNAHHHAGTTRMHDDPSCGVVDANCRVHELENLHIAGASVFPTAGFANPALTIVALALRLASHLRERF